jgi:hypothetical protein
MSLFQRKHPTGTVFLMSMIGPGATTANQIAAGNYSVNSADSADVILFSGLELAPGTYYLVLAGPTTSNAFWRQTLAPPTIVTAVSFTPGLDLRFAVTGTPIPEPSIGLLLGTGSLLLVALRFRRHS